MAKKIIVTVLAVILFTASIIITQAENQETIKNVPVEGNITYTSYMKKEDTRPIKNPELGINDKLVAENGNLALYLDKDQLIVKVLDKSNGYIWSSAASNEQLKGISLDWQRFGKSLLTMDFIMPNGTVKRSPLKHGSAKAPQITMMPDGFKARVNFFEAQINLDIVVKLLDDGIDVEIPDESIEYLGDNVISRLYVMPFFGASYSDDIPGYIFVPDGSGALIRYSKPKEYKSSFVGRIYGDDYSIKRPDDEQSLVPVVDVQQLSLPIFGIAHGFNRNAFLAIVESGEDYCEIEASPAGALTNFFWASPRFVYNDLYWQPMGTSEGFVAVQSKRNVVNAKVVYKLLNKDNANYMGMAKKYKEILKSEGLLTKKIDDKKNIPLKIDAIMAEQAKGLIGNKTMTMTKLSDTQRWIDELSSSGIDNLVVSLVGFEKKGVSGHRLDSFGIDKSVGSDRELKELYDNLHERGNILALQKEIMFGYNHQLNKNNALFHIDGGIVTKNEDKPLYDESIYLNAKQVSAYVNYFKNLPYYKKNIGLDSIGNILFSDYKKNKNLSREQTEGKMKEILSMAENNTNKLALEVPNVYGYKYADMVYNMPLASSHFTYESDSVPFLQILLSGYVECFSPYVNFSTNTVDDLLTFIDYNTYPSYVLTEDYSNKFADTNLNYIYSSRYDDWKSYIVRNHKYVNDILSAVKGKEMVARKVLDDGISYVEYDNGKSIIINYTNSDYKYKNIVIDKKSAKIVKGE